MADYAILFVEWGESYHDLPFKDPQRGWLVIDNIYESADWTPKIKEQIREKGMIRNANYAIEYVHIVGEIGYVRDEWGRFVADYVIWQNTVQMFGPTTSNLPYFFRHMIIPPTVEPELRDLRDFAVKLKAEPKLKTKIKVSKALLSRYVSLWEDKKE